MKCKKYLLKEFYTLLRYGTVGIINTIITLSVIFLLKLTSIHYVFYTLAGYAFGIATSFILNRNFTFKSHGKNTRKQAIKFISVTIILLLFTQFLQYLFIDAMGIPETIGVLMGMAFYTGTGYIINRNYVFR